MSKFTRKDKRRISRAIARLTRHIQDGLHQRQRIAKLLRERTADDGRVYLEIWSRDCDCMEGTELRHISPSVIDYERLLNDTMDNAEGPVRITILRPEEAEAWEAEWFDRAAAMMGY